MTSPNRPPSRDLLKPMVVYGRRLHPSTDLNGNIISENWITTTSDHPLLKGEKYVHLDQFLAEVRNKAIDMAEKDAEAMGRDLPAPIEDCMTFWLEDAMQELAKKIKEGKA